MKYLYLALISFVIYSCTTSMASELEAIAETGASSSLLAKTRDLSLNLATEQVEINDATQNDLVEEYYFNFKNKKYYVVRNKFYEYGLTDENHKVILEPSFDKLYHPNTTIANCMEVKNGEKLGLYNLVTGELLAPRFDYILPSGPIISVMGFANENGELVELNADNLSTWKSSQYSPWPLLINSLSFDIQKIGETRWYDTKLYSSVNNQGVVILPSYIEHLKLLSQDKYLVLADGDSYDEGNWSARAITTNERSLSENIDAFFVSVEESGMVGYEFQKKSDKLVVYNAESNSFNSITLHDFSTSIWGAPATYRFVNNSLIEVKSTAGFNPIPGYHFATHFTYYQVTDQGEIEPLQSARIYDFTKFIHINDTYFNGDFAYFMDKPYEEYNMYQLAHLTIADLDIMRNEIFAEYGYKFKSEKWQKYFASQSWYNPRYDDVNDKLTEVDKANVATILKLKAAMQAKGEEAYTKKKPITIHSAQGVG